ncbi:hypothetical protein CPB83DRAFT_841421 [Crepidotus variabilis]|uniref:Uncharacterized protein n=1 Tax=Crepidotus variabilis TaxID=179855 RepID=A0A9P6BCM1_9AGAR|nr:hypothetical protein CPB83DRAFT_841421 [Crepidotus variabilis]
MAGLGEDDEDVSDEDEDEDEPKGEDLEDDATRCRRNQRGDYVPNTRVGAPYEFLHRDGGTKVFAVLGLQSDQEHETRSKAMRTTVNPTYTYLIPHRSPELFPIGTLALHMHFVHDTQSELEDLLNIDYTVNKSWRDVPLLHGPSPTFSSNENAP